MNDFVHLILLPLAIITNAAVFAAHQRAKQESRTRA